VGFRNKLEKRKVVLEIRSGQIWFDGSGYPTKTNISKVFNEMNFHGATSANLWSFAILVDHAIAIDAITEGLNNGNTET